MPKLSQVIEKIEGLVITTSKKAAGIMSETLTAIEPELAKDLTTILQDGIPVAWAAFSTGGTGACIAASIAYIKIELPILAEEVQTALGAELALKAKSVLPAGVINTGLAASVSTAPVITPIPSNSALIIAGN